jgi:hypothetical protein
MFNAAMKAPVTATDPSTMTTRFEGFKARISRSELQSVASMGLLTMRKTDHFGGN